MRFFTALPVAVLLLASPAVAYAHAHLRSATPAVDSTIAASPPELAIAFTEALEPRFSSITVQDAAGKQVDKRDAHLAPTDATLFSVGLPTLPAGVYTVIWHATAVDTHKTEGKFSFTVKP